MIADQELMEKIILIINSLHAFSLLTSAPLPVEGRGNRVGSVYLRSRVQCANCRSGNQRYAGLSCVRPDAAHTREFSN